MRILAKGKIVLHFLFIGLSTCCINAQDQKNNLSQDPKFKQLLNEKRKINASLAVNDSYKIQIYSGGSENAKKTLSGFKQEFKDLDGTIVFNTPNYKVWVGNFRSRIDAERNLIYFKKKYSNAILIRPNK